MSSIASALQEGKLSWCSQNLCAAVLQEHVAYSTIDEELARDPETAKKIDQEISEGNFIP